MNYRQKMVQQQFLNNEEAVIRRLTQVYKQSLKDCTAKAAQFQAQIDELTAVYDTLEDEAEKEVMKSRIRSKIYQKQYQEAMRKQFDDILDDMHRKNYETVSEYLSGCYDEGFMGAMYDLQGQGIPLCFPIDQEAVTRAVQLDSKISEGLYQHMGEDVSMLKKHITAQVSRGISTGMAYEQIAQQLRFKMIGTYNNPGGSLAYSMRIARTEGHRIQVQSAMDACHKAKEKGADVVKQWDSTLDARTRTSHQHVDGEIRELDKPFSNGLMFPGDPDGGAAEVVNCRCALLQKARWELNDGFTKMNNFTKQLETFESPEDYAEFKKSFFSKENRQYMNYVSKMEEKYGTRNFAKVLDAMDTREYNHHTKLIESNPVFNNQVLTNSGNYGNITSQKVAPSKIQNYNFNEGTSAKTTSHVGVADCYTTAEGVNFIYQENYNKANQLIEPQRAMELFDKIPSKLKAEINTIEVLDYKNPMDGYWASRYKWKNFESFATGSGGHIAFWKNNTMATHAMDDNWIIHTYAHESAHSLDQTLGKGGIRFSNSAQWKKIVAEDKKINGKKSPTSYGEMNMVEDFAESVAEYCTNPVEFAKEFPNRANFFKGVL